MAVTFRRVLARRRIAGRFLAIGVAGWLGSLVCIAWWARRTVYGPADAIVVLGAAQYGGRPSPVLKARLDHAVALWHATQAPRIVVTGGQRVGDRSSEAAAGRRYLLERGIPAQAILLEPSGRTSLASIQGTASLLAGLQEVSTAGTARPRVLLVSDPFHMLRLDVLARLHGLRPLPSPTRSSPISAKGAVLEYMVRESLALPTDVALLCWLQITGRRGGHRAV